MNPLGALRRFLLRRRRAVYEPAIELAAQGASAQQVARALQPRSLEDGDLAEEVLLDALRLAKAPAATLRSAGELLGLVKANVNRLASPSDAARMRAVAALGLLGARAAIPPLLAELQREDPKLKLDVLAALSAIGDPAVLPHFIAAADELPEAELPGLASLMLEFGQAAYPALLPVINKHPAAFPPEKLKELLALAAASHDRSGPR